MQALQPDLAIDGVGHHQMLFRLTCEIGVVVVLESRPAHRVELLATDKTHHRGGEPLLGVDAREIRDQEYRPQGELANLFRNFARHFLCHQDKPRALAEPPRQSALRRSEQRCCDAGKEVGIHEIAGVHSDGHPVRRGSENIAVGGADGAAGPGHGDDLMLLFEGLILQPFVLEHRDLNTARENDGAAQHEHHRDREKAPAIHGTSSEAAVAATPAGAADTSPSSLARSSRRCGLRSLSNSSINTRSRCSSSRT